MFRTADSTPTGDEAVLQELPELTKLEIPRSLRYPTDQRVSSARTKTSSSQEEAPKQASEFPNPELR